ncbi:hypothetical protein Bsp3421_001752 [Burkholderia sp. FERM BP-3421]|uniref:hypothetical protein n=1 Tax=Burkholderia sp. FERM BP-3421 TaxID=1494466 RepID=UPI00235EA87E|nr:hypothetical protein [Burkholderia sp. FERM BP-3421]WDD91802.1 hypothetical protein Bsp3421_001752 [Burkholderia sp. FERM BP-3421]
MKRAGFGLCLLTCAALAHAGDHYVEIWNPPEARGAAPRAPAAAPAPAKPRRAAPHVVPANVRRAPAIAATPKFTARPRSGAPSVSSAPRGDIERTTPDMSATPQIPRMITPDGNVLQVGTGRRHAEVVR